MGAVEAANEAVVRRIYAEVLNGQHAEVVPDLFDPAVVDHRAFPGMPTGLQNILEGARLNRKAFPDLEFTLQDVVAGGDLVFAHWRMAGTHRGTFQGRPATGAAIEWRGITQFRLSDGRVAERWLYADDAGLLRQIEAADQTFLLFVNGTLMRGLALHPNLDGAEFVREDATVPCYRVHSIDDRHPGMYRVAEGGVAVAGEVYRLPPDVWARVESGEPPNLYRGVVELADGTEMWGILYPQNCIQPSHRDISEFGGWRGYMAAKDAGRL